MNKDINQDLTEEIRKILEDHPQPNPDGSEDEYIDGFAVAIDGILELIETTLYSELYIGKPISTINSKAKPYGLDMGDIPNPINPTAIEKLDIYTVFVDEGFDVSINIGDTTKLSQSRFLQTSMISELMVEWSVSSIIKSFNDINMNIKLSADDMIVLEETEAEPVIAPTDVVNIAQRYFIETFCALLPHHANFGIFEISANSEHIDKILTSEQVDTPVLPATIICDLT